MMSTTACARVLEQMVKDEIIQRREEGYERALRKSKLGWSHKSDKARNQRHPIK